MRPAMVVVEVTCTPLIDSLCSYALSLAKRPPSTVRADLAEMVVEEEGRVRIGVGNEAVTFEEEGETFSLHRKRMGPSLPSHSMNHLTVSSDLVELTSPSIASAKRVCRNAMVQDDKETRSGGFRLLTWDASAEYWKRKQWVRGRPSSSVVLNNGTLSDLMSDLDGFRAPEVQEWYDSHGVPHRRGYLFFGPPGTGKTSTIHALATLLNRSVYRVNLVAPRLTDDSLCDAISLVKPHSIVVMEDVDCIFGKMRDKQEEQCAVTFSGLLNALDGLTHARGTLFIFTSNHPDRLDSALRRKGRIDREFEFGHCTRQQSRDMFLRFYPNETALAESFSASVSTRPTATLQEHFVRHRTSPALNASRFDDLCDAEADTAVGRMVS